jgi:predicted CXXCH cytochrome family protein
MTDERYKSKTQWILAASVAVISLAAVAVAALYPWDLGARQPISFSHRVHAGKKEIGCVMCHPGVFKTPVAGIPPVETCMLCHSRIIIHYPEIEKVRRHYEEGRPILWVRVNNLPDFVHFDHSMHIASGIDCGKCHGDIKAMDRIVLHQKFIMGFCIQCHREYNATRDCFACHY